MGPSGYQYDANGNLIDDGKRSYQWDAADRLIEITDTQTGHTSQFAYDGLNRRISETETDQGGSPITTRFQWCGERICEKRDSNDTVLARYYDEGELHGNQPLYYAQDQVGSVVAVVNGQGQVIGRISYDSYGNVIQQQGTLPDYRYAGLYAHAESGLYLATYRAYDPETVRWLSRDPIRENGGVNLYGYVGNNPVRYTDSSGLDAVLPYPIASSFGEVVASTVGEVAAGTLGTSLGIIGGLIYSSPVGEGSDVVPNYLNTNASEGVYSSKDFWNGLDRCKGGGTRTNGERGKKRRFYEWDHTHGDVEVYDGRGKHLGSADPQTGEMTKPPVPGREIDR